MTDQVESLQIDPAELPEKLRGTIITKLRAPGGMIIAIDDKVATSVVTIVNEKTPFLIAISVGPDCTSGIKPGDRFISEKMLGINLAGETIKVVYEKVMLLVLPKADAPKEGVHPLLPSKLIVPGGPS